MSAPWRAWIPAARIAIWPVSRAAGWCGKATTRDTISARSRQQRTLATRKLPPGTYTLTVSVTDGKDRVRNVATTFEIAKDR